MKEGPEYREIIETWIKCNRETIKSLDTQGIKGIGK